MRNEFETITVERRDDYILLVTLNRPEAANALNTQMGLDLVELFEGFSDRSSKGCGSAILTGARRARHSAPAVTLKERKGMTDEAWDAAACRVRTHATRHHELPGAHPGRRSTAWPMAAAPRSPPPCDFIYAAEHARFALTEVTLGIMPGLRRHAEPAARSGRTPGERNRAHRPAIFGPRKPELNGASLIGFCQPTELMKEANATRRRSLRETRRSLCGKPSMPFTTVCRCHSWMRWPSRSRPTTARFRAKTVARAFWPSMSAASRISGADDFRRHRERKRSDPSLRASFRIASPRSLSSSRALRGAVGSSQ